MHWSETSVEGALAFFSARKAVPKFKFTNNAGRSDLVRDCGGVNKKKFYDGVAQFVKAAKQWEGVLTLLSNLPQRPVAVFLNDRSINVVPVEMGVPISLEEMQAVVVVHESSAAQHGQVKTMAVNQFIQAGVKDGAGLSLEK